MYECVFNLNSFDRFRVIQFRSIYQFSLARIRIHLLMFGTHVIHKLSNNRYAIRSKRIIFTFIMHRNNNKPKSQRDEKQQHILNWYSNYWTRTGRNNFESTKSNFCTYKTNVCLCESMISEQAERWMMNAVVWLKIENWWNEKSNLCDDVHCKER